jgi:TPR repeat protein
MNRYILILLISLPSVAISNGPLHDCSEFPIVTTGMAKEDFQDRELSIQKLIPMAEEGNGTAQHFLASYLLEGNPTEAIKWARLSVENSCIDGALLLGIIYQEGSGVEKDLNEAFTWYLTAAEAGNVPAASMVSHMYYEGRGVSKDEAKSLYWLHVSRGEL